MGYALSFKYNAVSCIINSIGIRLELNVWAQSEQSWKHAQCHIGDRVKPEPDCFHRGNLSPTCGSDDREMTVASRTAESHCCCAYFNNNSNNDWSWQSHPVTGEINKRRCKTPRSAGKDAATVLIKNRWIICVNLSPLYLIREENTVVSFAVLSPRLCSTIETVFQSRDLEVRHVYWSTFSLQK